MTIRVFIVVLVSLLFLACFRIYQREKEMASYATRSMLILISDANQIPSSTVEKVVYEMNLRNMKDRSTAVLLFRLLEKSDKGTISSNQEIIDYLTYMSKEHKGKDKPLWDKL